MRVKLTALIVASAVLATALLAHAAPVTVALYRFQTRGDVQAFQKVKGAKCTKKWRKRKTLGVVVGKATNACGFRSSVLADSSDGAPDQEMAGAANLAAATPKALRKKVYLGVAVRQSDSTSYELRVLPGPRKWQVWRDPKGSGGPNLLASGAANVIRPGAGKRNNLLLRAFDFGSATVRLLARVNGKKVLQTTDGSANAPDGRRTVVTVGAKGDASARGAVGAFDNVAVRVPNPF
jgi:hypothetical protein